MTNGLSILIVGAGRMGLRHALGALDSHSAKSITIVDIAAKSLEAAKEQFDKHVNKSRLSYELLQNFHPVDFDVVIIASTASNRIESCGIAKTCNAKHVLIEKPLGQSLHEVEELVAFFEGFDGKVYVNLNTRLYPFIKKLREDLHTLPQFQGPININFNGGSLGIGANGIHYLDLVFFLYGASEYKLVYRKVDKEMLASGRGPQFGDFGGVAVIEFYNEENSYLGRANITLSATSSAFGGWDIVGTHGRITINELEQARVDILRKPDSEMPINRYAADYMPGISTPIESPYLNTITQEWLDGLQDNSAMLPEVHESLKVHKLMFEWLSDSPDFNGKFPIT